MPRFAHSSYLPVPPAEAYAWHARPGALARLMPPWEHARIIDPGMGIEEGARAVLSVRVGPLRRRWVAVHYDCRRGEQFSDRQERGPFAAWTHTHRFLPQDEDGCKLEDDIDYRLPYGPLGRLAAGDVDDRLARSFRWRHQRTLADLGRHRDFRQHRPLRIAIGGASGLVGSELSAFLTGGGHTVLPLIRRGGTRAGIPWDPEVDAIDAEPLQRCDAVVHLGGASIARRWTARARREIRDSRVRSTRLLAETLARGTHRPQALIVASAIGWYGDRGEELVDEGSAAGDGFLAEVCRDWEAACEPARQAGIRVITLRIGMVVSGRGGALPRMVAPFRWGLGGPVGSGEQWVSWIALDDLVYAIHHALLTPTLAGVVNAVAPVPVRQRDLSAAIARVLRTRERARVPAWVIGAALGEMGRSLLLGGCRVASRQLEHEVFAFACPDIERALRWELGRLRAPREEEPPAPMTPIG
jgi:uncharacterized protein (TIGR01777 family)